MILTLVGGCSDMKNNKKKQEYKNLTEEEKRVIIHKGTEAPFTGKFVENFDSGIYLCKQCNAPLYRSEDKFHSECGWPSFDDEIPGTVERKPDKDGRRTEILCNNCGGHLGHVFIGEGYTKKNTRHCVNSISMKFIKTETAIFAGGCFWGVEYHFNKVDGVIFVEVGYIGGTVDNPTYKQVCDGNTGHAEATRIFYDHDKVDYEELAKLFFEIHDPTQVNRQGPDIGYQYRSAVFYTNDEQKKIAEKLIVQLEQKNYDIATTIEKTDKFWVAENYHQDYYENKGIKPYCHSYTKRF